MNLIELEGEKVRLTSVSGHTFEGIVGDYIFPEDNAPEEIEAIILDYPIRDDGYKYKNPVEFTAKDIQSIEIIE